ncbi:hypothetical protein JVU11DRAFT_304 [Chiua virens]|nr:hypothetical protein JVU11DRAFT_304 [Chiua virens]
MTFSTLPLGSRSSQSRPVPALGDLPDGSVDLSPTVSPVSSASSARSSPTIRSSSNTPSKVTQKPSSKLLHRFSFLRSFASSSDPSLSRSPSQPYSRSATSLPSSPASQSAKLSRISTEDILTLFRTRSGSSSSARTSRPSSPPPKFFDSSKSLHRSATTGSGLGINLGIPNRDSKDDSSHSHNAAAISNSPRKRRVSSSAMSPGAGGGRHSSAAKMLPNEKLPVRPSTAPSSPLQPPKKQVKMLNGRIYGAKRYAAQTLANPFANVREEPEFVEWGYGGMGSVQASDGVASDMWKGLQRSERGGALLASSYHSRPGTPTGAVAVGEGRDSDAQSSLSVARRKMSIDIPECGMGNVGAGGEEDDGSGMGWVKRRRAEKEAKARLEQEAKELEKKTQEGRRSPESVDASVYTSTASPTTSLTACTSSASTDLTTPTTSPITSRSPSVVDVKITSSPVSESHDLIATPPCAVIDEQPSKPDSPFVLPAATSKNHHEHHVLTAVRLSANISNTTFSHGHPEPHGRAALVDSSPVDTETTNSSGGEEELSRDSDEGDVDDEDEAQDISRRTALGAGIEKISRYVDVEAR